MYEPSPLLRAAGGPLSLIGVKWPGAFREQSSSWRYAVTITVIIASRYYRMLPGEVIPLQLSLGYTSDKILRASVSKEGSYSLEVVR